VLTADHFKQIEYIEIYALDKI